MALPAALAFLCFHGTALHVQAVLEPVPAAFAVLIVLIWGTGISSAGSMKFVRNEV